MSLLPARRHSEAKLARRDTTPKAQVAIITVCVVLIVVIAAAVLGWFLWRLRHKPKRVKHVNTKAAIRLDDSEGARQALMDEPRPVPVASARGMGGVEGWLQQTQRTAPSGGPQSTPRTPRTAALPLEEAPAAIVPPSPPPAAVTFQHGRAASPFERPVSAQSSLNQSSEQTHGHQHQHSGSNPHARPLAFIKHMFNQPAEDGASERPTTPTVARLPMMPPPPHAPHRPPRPDSLVLSQSAYEIYPDASASQYGGGRRRGSASSDVVPPMPEMPRSFARRQSYSALSSQGGLPLPSLYLPSEQGDGAQPALAIGESVLASPLDNRHTHLEPPRRGGPRRPASNFVVTNATAEDD